MEIFVSALLELSEQCFNLRKCLGTLYKYKAFFVEVSDEVAETCLYLFSSCQA